MGMFTALIKGHILSRLLAGSRAGRSRSIVTAPFRKAALAGITAMLISRAMRRK